MKHATTGSTAVMAQRRESPDALDHFPTPPWATRALFRHVLPSLGIERIETGWEPACAEGLMAEVIAEFASGQVIGSDVFDYGYGQAPVDFVNDEPLARPDWVITNPPFALACEFALRALDLATEGVALLVRTQWIEGIGRYEKLFRDRPLALYAPFVERVPMVKGRWDPAASTATSYAWFVWRKAASGSSRVLWIRPGCRRELARPDDVARFAAWSLVPSEAPLLHNLRSRCTIDQEDYK
ncbi:MAG: hypothetical protein QOD56_3155 [Gammaproteobacteria bacterium]|nr:hypothetical protein [Gammaproteobacteria bacterium]